MPAYRFYQDTDLEENATCLIEKDECHHLKNVMRLKENEEIEIINGKGFLAVAEIQEIQKRKAIVKINKVSFYEKKYEFILLQAVPKIFKIDSLIEKGTELGASAFHFFHAEKSPSKLSEEKLQRFEQKALAAMKQSGRVYLPKLKIIPPLLKWKDSFENAYFGDLRLGAPPLSSILPKQPKETAYYFCCGPEAGFSEREIKHLEDLNFKGVLLHSNILRTENAPLTFLNLIHHRFLSHLNQTIVN